MIELPCDERGPLPGVYQGVPSAMYHGIRYLSASKIAMAAATSLQEAALSVFHPTPLTGAMRQGIALHSMILEGGDPRALVTKNRNRSSAHLRRKEQQTGQPLLEASDLAVVDSVAATWETHPDAELFRRILGVCPMRELTIIGEDPETGTRTKVRADAYGEVSAVGADLKTGEMGSVQEVRRKMRRRGYDIQGTFYADGIRASGLGEVRHWSILAIHTRSRSPEYGTFTLDESMMEACRPVIRAVLRAWAKAEATGVWPGRFGPMEIPLKHYPEDAMELLEIERRMSL